ncbi:uncharacterized protein LTR77_011240 [Saxophila tyrrhenica]|uniref:Uncharacterized protein n=1 Tax=Saxophila tyrrhenica TaxID=1690608 RepID=A0AAV9NT16_9PEZI|nr:hypothetical protein LTR77_011240 [Saxophila tyrrhenica]
MVCTMYTVTNGCGHSETIRYRNCGEHSDTVRDNALCFHEAPVEKRNKPTRVSMGARFCNKGCKALTAGWRCCTCGYKEVHGYYDPVVGVVVHQSKGGDIHAFCLTCRDVDVSLFTNSNETMSETVVTRTNQATNRTRTRTPSLTYTSDEYDTDSEDLFFDASPRPIESSDQDEYQDHNSCAIMGKDLDMIARTFEGTNMSLSPVTTPTKSTYEGESVYRTRF